MCDLKAKFKEWEERLIGSDVNSIKNQITSMMEDSAIFQSIIECRKNAPKNENNEIELNSVVHRFIDKCFFETQALAIRRLSDKRKDGNSLRRLIGDIENHIKKHPESLTRKNILAAHDDRVKPQIFKWLRQRLDKYKEIDVFVNKFLAHAATPESRNYLKPNELDVTLGQILEAHEIICQTAIVIGGRMGILSKGHGFPDVLPIPPNDQFKYFDKAWASEETIKKLYAFWCKYDLKTRSWHKWEWENEFYTYLRS